MILKKTAARILLAVAAACILLLTAGCWDDAEINGRAFVLGFGTDENTGGTGYYFTFQLAIPVSGASDSSGSIEYTRCTVAANSPAVAIAELENNLGRQINFEQLNLIVIGESLSHKYFLNLTEYFFRRASVRRQSCIAVCSGSARDFFASAATDKSISTDAAVTLQSYDDTNGPNTLSMNLYTLYKTVSNRDEFYLLRLSPVAADSPGNPPASGSGQDSDNEKKYVVSISGALTYGRDGNYKGDVSADELEMMKLISGSRTSGVLTAYDSQSNSRYCTQIRQSDCSTECSFADGTLEFHIRVSIVLAPLDSEGINGGAYTSERSRRIGKCAEETVSAKLMAIADRSRASLGSSVLGLQDIVRQRMPDSYELYQSEWERIFASSTIRFSVNCQVAGGGITK